MRLICQCNLQVNGLHQLLQFLVFCCSLAFGEFDRSDAGGGRGQAPVQAVFLIYSLKYICREIALVSNLTMRVEVFLPTPALLWKLVLYPWYGKVEDYSFWLVRPVSDNNPTHWMG